MVVFWGLSRGNHDKISLLRFCSCYLYKTRTFGSCDVHASNTRNLRWTLKKNRVLDELQWNKTAFAFPKVCFTLLHNGVEASFDLFSLFHGCWGCNTDQHWPAQCVASECLQKTAWMCLSSTNHSLLACRPWMMNMMNQQKFVVFPDILKNCSEEGLQYMRPGCCYRCPKICNLETREIRAARGKCPAILGAMRMAAMFSVDLIELVGSVTVSAPLFNRERSRCVLSWYPSWKLEWNHQPDDIQMISLPSRPWRKVVQRGPGCLSQLRSGWEGKWLGYNLPSGKHRKSYWKWPSRNSWFTY